MNTANEFQDKYDAVSALLSETKLYDTRINEETETALSTFLIHHGDFWLEDADPLDGWTDEMEKLYQRNIEEFFIYYDI